MKQEFETRIIESVVETNGEPEDNGFYEFFHNNGRARKRGAYARIELAPLKLHVKNPDAYAFIAGKKVTVIIDTDDDEPILRNNVYRQQHTPRNGLKGDVWFREEEYKGKTYMQKYICGEYMWERDRETPAEHVKELSMDEQQAIYAIELQLNKLHKVIRTNRHLQLRQELLEYEGLADSLKIVLDLAKRSACKEGM